MPPLWLIALSWAALPVAFASTAPIAWTADQAHAAVAAP